MKIKSQLLWSTLLFLALSFGASPCVKAQAGESTQAILAEVSKLMASREFPAALALFDKIDTAAMDYDLQLLRASVLNAAGRSADARAIASAIVSRDKNNVDALLVLATSATIEGNDQEQRRFLEQVLKIDAGNLKALSDLGYIALRARSLRTAAGHFDKALSVDGDYGEALVGRAIVFRYARDPKNSEQFLNKAITLYPDWSMPLSERARLYKGEGYPEDALADLDKAKTLEPDNYWISVDRAAVLLDLDRRQEALEEVSYAVSLDQKGFLGLVYRAGLREEFGDFEGAEQDYLALTQIRPEYYFAAEGLGVLKMRKRDYAGARDAFLAAFKEAPKEFSYALLAAANWMKAGKPSDPRKFLAQTLRDVPKDSAEWRVLRMYHDLSGDRDAVDRVNQEQNLDTKSRMLFHLAYYFDIMGNKVLASSFYQQVKDLGIQSNIEWKLNELALERKGS